MAVGHPVWGTICEICYCSVNLDNCAIAVEGTKWDIHSGACAKQAGIEEKEIRVEHICEYAQIRNNHGRLDN